MCVDELPQRHREIEGSPADRTDLALEARACEERREQVSGDVWQGFTLEVAGAEARQLLGHVEAAVGRKSAHYCVDEAHGFSATRAQESHSREPSLRRSAALSAEHAAEAQQVGEDAGRSHGRAGARAADDQRVVAVAARHELHDVVGQADVRERVRAAQSCADARRRCARGRRSPRRSGAPGRCAAPPARARASAGRSRAGASRTRRPMPSRARPARGFRPRRRRARGRAPSRARG